MSNLTMGQLRYLRDKAQFKHTEPINPDTGSVDLSRFFEGRKEVSIVDSEKSTVTLDSIELLLNDKQDAEEKLNQYNNSTAVLSNSQQKELNLLQRGNKAYLSSTQGPPPQSHLPGISSFTSAVKERGLPTDQGEVKIEEGADPINGKPVYYTEARGVKTCYSSGKWWWSSYKAMTSCPPKTPPKNSAINSLTLRTTKGGRRKTKRSKRKSSTRKHRKGRMGGKQ